MRLYSKNCFIMSTEEEPTATSARPTRERKQVERIAVEPITKEKAATEIPEGSGICLSDYPFFVTCFEKLRTDDDVCKQLHQVMFGAPGTKNDRKKNIRKFSGFASGTDISDKVSKVVDRKGFNNTLLKDTLGLLGLEKSGTRQAMAQRLVEFLESPQILKREALATPAKKSGKKRKLSKKVGKDGAPKAKRAPSAYLLFSQAIREEVKAANPDASFGEIGKLLGARWSELSEEDKQQWKDKSAATDKTLQAEGGEGWNVEDGGEDDDEAFDDSSDDQVEAEAEEKETTEASAPAAEEEA